MYKTSDQWYKFRHLWGNVTKITQIRRRCWHERCYITALMTDWSAGSFISTLSHWVTLFSVPHPCEGGQLLSDRRVGATDSLPRVHTRQSSGDPQHLFLFHQLCRGSVGHIWSRLSLIASECLLFFFTIWRSTLFCIAAQPWICFGTDLSEHFLHPTVHCVVTVNECQPVGISWYFSCYQSSVMQYAFQWDFHVRICHFINIYIECGLSVKWRVLFRGTIHSFWIKNILLKNIGSSL